MKDLYIIGTGSQARYVIEICRNYKIKGMFDILSRDNIGTVINGVEVIGFVDDVESMVDKDEADIIIAYGKNDRKMEIAEHLSKKGYRFATVISENAYISSFVEVGEGTIINPNVTVMPNTKIGKHVIIHSGSVIEHDNVLDDFVNVAPRVSTAGNVKIGKASYLYTGSVVIPKITIGKNAVVGAGAVVLKDVDDNSTVVGVPAKVIKVRE